MHDYIKFAPVSYEKTEAGVVKGTDRDFQEVVFVTVIKVRC